MTNTAKTFIFTLAMAGLPVAAGAAGPVPGYVPPVTMTDTPDYADDTRGVFVPSHPTYRLLTSAEQQNVAGEMNDNPMGVSTLSYNNGYMQQAELNGGVDVPANSFQVAGGYGRNTSGYGNVTGNAQDNEMDRIANDQGMLAGGMQRQQTYQQPYAAPYNQQPSYNQQPYMQQQPDMAPQQPAAPVTGGYDYYQPQPHRPATPAPVFTPDGNGGVEIAAGATQASTLDMQNSLVRLREDRITVRRALRRMMDQIGGGDWAIVWDLAESNAGLPEMEISLYAEEPFMNVLNALLARVQTRSGQPLRVIRYDNARRLVITDRTGGYRLSDQTAAVGVEGAHGPAAVTEKMLNEAKVSLHYEEIPLVDALESLVNQAGKGQWRLRVYAGSDQTLKPAHVEEPFNVAMERILRLFNLKFEVFAGGKLVVVTNDESFGFNHLMTR